MSTQTPDPVVPETSETTAPPSPATLEAPAIPARPVGPADEIDWKAKARHEEKRAKDAEDARAQLLAQLEEAKTGSAEAEKLRAEIAERDQKLLQHEAAAKAGAPQLAGRLKGATVEEMEADARGIITSLANPFSGSTAPQGSQAPSANLDDLVEKIRRKF